MRVISLLLLFALGVKGFEFPEDDNTVATDPISGQDEYEYIDPEADGDSDDPPVNDSDLSTRFFFGQPRGRPVQIDLGQLGAAAGNFLTHLAQGQQPNTGQIGAGQPLQQEDQYDDYPQEEQASHGFPTNPDGSINCARVPRRQRRECRRAKRQQRKEDRANRGRNTGEVATNSQQLIAQVKNKCCLLLNSGDLFSFNMCCKDYGFCPICDLDIGRLSTDECCPLQHSGDEDGYKRCCVKYGACPTCGPPPTLPAPRGCPYKGQLHLPGSQMDKLPYKCLFVRCEDLGNGPETVLNYLDVVGCCEEGGDLFPPGSSFEVDTCTNRVCVDGQWEQQDSEAAAVFSHPCPDGWLDLRGHCVYIWREMMTWEEAKASCGRLRATLFLPTNQNQMNQLIAAFENMEGRDSSEVLGGWIDARDSGQQWETSGGDTLTYQAWEAGHPDALRRTGCAALVVTDKSRGWKDFLCANRQNMMYPICQVEKHQCGEASGGCGPIQGDMMFIPNSDISNDECEILRCNQNSYIERHVNPECCYVQEWRGQAFGRERGWYAGLYPPGGFQLYTGLLCECENAQANCTLFFDF